MSNIHKGIPRQWEKIGRVKTNDVHDAKRLPVIYSCSGCSDAGELADRVARTVSENGVAQMSCLAGIGGRVKSLMLKAQRAERIVVVDGCPLNCARHTLLNAGFKDFQHIALQDLGHRKGACPPTVERIAEASAKVAELIEAEGRQKPLTAAEPLSERTPVAA